MSLFDKIWGSICNWANETKETYEQEKANMENKTDSQLIELVKSGSLGKRKAALEELRNRGIVK